MIKSGTTLLENFLERPTEFWSGEACHLDSAHLGVRTSRLIGVITRIVGYISYSASPTLGYSRDVDVSSEPSKRLPPWFIQELEMLVELVGFSSSLAIKNDVVALQPCACAFEGLACMSAP